MKAINKKIVFVVLTVLSVLSLAYLYFSSRPQSKTVPVSPSLQTDPLVSESRFTQTAITSISVSGSLIFPSIPKTLPVFSDLSSTQTDFLPLAVQLAKFFQLQPSPTISNTWVGTDRSLYLNALQQFLGYSVDSLKSRASFVGPNKPSLSPALETTTVAAKQFPLWKDFLPQKEQVSYLRFSTSHLDPATSTDAHLIQIPFFQFIKNIPLVRGSRTFAPLMFIVGQNNQIVKIEAYLNNIVPSSTPEDRPTINSREAIQLLKSKQVLLLDIQTDDILPVPPSQIDNIVISEVFLEYRTPTQPGQKILPYYHFVGQSGSAKIHLLLPAVK